MLAVLFWILFIVSALLLSLIILIQEGKGGGLAEAFGGMGQETFGTGAKGVNRVTATLAAIFLLSSILINKASDPDVSFDAPEAPIEAPVENP
jgi:preprotein translocase subunit SecG